MVSSFQDIEREVLALIEQDGIDAAQDKYLGQSVDFQTRQLARAIFGNLTQDTITGEWSLKNK